MPASDPSCSLVWVLIRYYFDYERARIWRSGALETSRHDRSVQRPFRGFGGATWTGSVLRRVAPDQTEARANSYAVGRSCRRPERAPHAASCGCDPYRSSHSYECVPPFTHGVLCRAMRFTIPTVMREP